MTDVQESPSLNENTMPLIEELCRKPWRYKADKHTSEAGVEVWDLSRGGIEAGLLLARVCMANLASVELAPPSSASCGRPCVQVTTDFPVQSCLFSQYAGWQVSGEKFFGMGSGPMRAAKGTEEILEELGCRRDTSTPVVGVLEAQFPAREGALEEACTMISEKCQIEPEQLILLFAPTASLAGTIQVVARSVETALHKIHEVCTAKGSQHEFDLHRVVSGYGLAPLPPVAENDLGSIGRTNDSVLYGAQVVLEVTGADDGLPELVKELPSCSSDSHGKLFAVLFEEVDRDFYQMDPLLFSPAQVTVSNIDTGNSFTHGEPDVGLVSESFCGTKKDEVRAE